jgi:hypothetical protein
MVNTIHRSIVEKLQVEVPDTAGSDEIFGVSSKLVETNEERFKESLKNNIPCYVHRETFVVEHDTEKNKVIFKRYFVRKNPVEVKKIKTIKLKTYKAYKSLTIDIATGDFTTYSIDTGGRRRKKHTPVVRKTIFTHQVISVIESIFDGNLIPKESIHDGLNKGIKILGYDQEITSMFSQEYLKIVYRDNKKKINIYNYVSVFIAHNFLKKLGIKLPNTHNILEYASNFKIDKKSYIDKSIYSYYANYFGADELFIRGLFDYRDQLNMSVYIGNKDRVKSDNWFTDAITAPIVESFYAINEEGLTILYKLGYTLSEIKSSQQLLNIVYTRENNQIVFYKNPLELPLDILIENKEFFRSIIKDTTLDTIMNMLNTLRTLHDVYGIKTSAYIMYLSSTNIILKALHQAVEETGLYVVSKPFLNRLKKQLPKNAKCSVTKHINKKIENESSIFSLLKNHETAYSTIQITHKTEKMRLMVYESSINYRIYDKKISLSLIDKPSKTYLLDKAFRNFSRNYEKNKNKLKYSGLKAHYSVKRFEELLRENFSEKDLKSITENLVYLK